MEEGGRAMKRIITLDIETVSDPTTEYSAYEQLILDKWQGKVEDFQTKKEAGETRKYARAPEKPTLKSEEPGLHWLTGKICCIGICDLGTLRDDGKPKFIAATGKDERKILKKFQATLSEIDPTTFVTFNGLTFDMPFLIHRVERYDEFSEIMNRLPSLNKYDRRHIDIYDRTGGRWSINAKLQEYAIHYGFNYPLELDASMTQDLYDADKLKEIEKKCKYDNWVTAALYGKLAGVLEK